VYISDVFQIHSLLELPVIENNITGLAFTSIGDDTGRRPDIGSGVRGCPYPHQFMRSVGAKSVLTRVDYHVPQLRIQPWRTCPEGTCMVAGP
jgi:hypothetical protein